MTNLEINIEDTVIKAIEILRKLSDNYKAEKLYYFAEQNDKNYCIKCIDEISKKVKEYEVVEDYAAERDDITSCDCCGVVLDVCVSDYTEMIDFYIKKCNISQIIRDKNARSLYILSDILDYDNKSENKEVIFKIAVLVITFYNTYFNTNKYHEAIY